MESLCPNDVKEEFNDFWDNNKLDQESKADREDAIGGMYTAGYDQNGNPIMRRRINKDVKKTPYEMAPEIVDEGTTGPYTDLWYLGILVYQLVTGDLPFTEGKTLE